MFRPHILTGLCAAVALAAIAERPAAVAAGPFQDDQSREPALFALVRPAPGVPIETRHLTLRTSTSAASAAPGARVTLLVEITPKPKMHVYAPEQKDVIPVTLVLAPTPEIRAGSVRFPASETYFFAPLKETQRVYSKPFRIAQEVTIADTRPVRERASAGATITVTGHVRYQACDETICYLPQKVPVVWTIDLGPRAPEESGR